MYFDPQNFDKSVSQSQLSNITPAKSFSKRVAQTTPPCFKTSFAKLTNTPPELEALRIFLSLLHAP